jgi:beta-galactosidase
MSSNPQLGSGDSKRITMNFKWDWSFRLGEHGGEHLPDYDDSGWRKLDLPHDWSIEGPYEQQHPAGKRGGFLPAGIGWYRKSFDFDPDWSNHLVFVEFDGIYMNSEVWMNGHSLGTRPYGYIGLQYELTPHLLNGTNVIAVRVDHSKAPSGRWYTGSGIYRQVRLTVKAPVHVGHWGMYVTTPEVTEQSALISIRTLVNNRCKTDSVVTVLSRIMDEQGSLVAEASSEMCIGGGTEQEFTDTAVVKHPCLWSPEAPHLYTLQTLIIRDGQHEDEETTKIGIRYFSFDGASGFSLNGRPVKLKGVCQHEDAGPVGTAVPDKVLERRLRLLKEMGCNAIRTGHHPMSPAFYDGCDRIGFLVLNEAFDGWDEPKAEFDYGLYFKDWWERDLGDLLRRDRNHPCVILWSVGNEVKGKTDDKTTMIQDFVHRHEPTRPVTCGRGEEGIFDVQGYNGHGGEPGVLEKAHEQHPERKIILTEEPHTYQTRGFYRTQTWWRDKNRPRLEIPNLTEEEIFFDGAIQYNSSYDNSGVRRSIRDTWRRTRDLPFIGGEFRWTGFDYLGESNSGWPARMGNKGVLDLCGFPKDHYYFYQSQWTERPMVHLLPHWTHPGMEGVIIPVWAYTNCDSVELILNGISLGEQMMEDRMNLFWDVAYEPGTLDAIARKDGAVAAVKTVRTASDPVGIRLYADQGQLAADGQDISHVTFEIVDKVGSFVPAADNLITFHVSGPVTILGMDNGDPLDLTPHRSNSRKVFNGLGLAILQSTFEEGDIELTAAGILGDHLFERSAQVAIDVQPILLRGQQHEGRYSIYYTTDGSEPDVNSALFERPFTITESCTVCAAIYKNGCRMMAIQSAFTKGQRAKVIDLTHGNGRPESDESPGGPFDKEMVGTWGNGSQILFMEPDGTVQGPAYGDKRSKVGEWWYDFPEDPFEHPDYAGTGEIWWSDGKRSDILLIDQSGAQMIVLLHGHELIFDKKT